MSSATKTRQREWEYITQLEYTAQLPPDIVKEFVLQAIEEHNNSAGENGYKNLVELCGFGERKLRSIVKEPIPRIVKLDDMDEVASICSFTLQDILNEVDKRYPEWPIGWDDPRIGRDSVAILRRMMR